MTDRSDDPSQARVWAREERSQNARYPTAAPPHRSPRTDRDRRRQVNDSTNHSDPNRVAHRPATRPSKRNEWQRVGDAQKRVIDRNSGDGTKLARKSWRQKTRAWRID